MYTKHLAPAGELTVLPQTDSLYVDLKGPLHDREGTIVKER